MKRQKTVRQKFKWKFTKRMFQRPLETTSFLALLKEQERNWRGTLLAVMAIGFISAVIVITALFVTSNEERISYERFTIEELMWLGDRARDLNYFWHKDQFIYSHPDSTWKVVDVAERELRTFDDTAEATKTMEFDLTGLTPISAIRPNPQQTAWLIQFDENRKTLQEVTYRYAIVFPFNKKRIYVDPNRTGNDSGFLHFAEWGKNEFSLFAHQGSQLYYTEDVRSHPAGHSFRCLTCSLEPRWTFGYPGWIYRQYFQYRPHEAIWEHDDPSSSLLLLLATDEQHLKNLLLPQYLVGDPSRFHAEIEKAVYVPFQSQTQYPRVPLVNILLMNHSGRLLANISWSTLNNLMERIFPKTAYISEHNRGLYITRVQWFNATGFLVAGLSETQKCGFILFCQWSAEVADVGCQYVWYQCIEVGWMNMHQLTIGDLFVKYERENEVLTILPYVTSFNGFFYQLAVLRIISGHKNRVTWLTENPFQVDQLVYSDAESILVTGSFRPGIRHLYRLVRGSINSLYCLTCNELGESMTDVILIRPTNASRNITIEPVSTRNSFTKSTNKQPAYRSVQKARSSANGRCFTVQWSTGYETFGASGVKEAPTKWMINQLTGAGFNANDSGHPMLEPKVRFDPDSGVSLWCRSRQFPMHVYLVWHSHYIIESVVKSNWTADQYLSNIPTSFRRDLRASDTVMQDTQSTKSAKQHQVPTNTYHTKVKFKLLNASRLPLHMLYPEPPFGDRPMPNVIMRHINLKPKDNEIAQLDQISTVTLASEDEELIKDGVVVRIWFPPYLNEGNQQRYPLLVNVVSKLAPTLPPSDRLAEELTVFMSASLDVVVMRVEHWTGEAEDRVHRGGIDGELQNYQALFHVLNGTLRYHYLEKNKTAVFGSQGMNAHLAGLILRTPRIPMNPACGALVAPIVSWQQHDFTEAVRIFPAPNEFAYLDFDLTKDAQYCRQKEILLVHGTADTVVPFSQTAQLVKVLSEQKVDFSLLPLFDGDHNYENTSMHKAILTKIIVFLNDCLRRTEDDRRKMQVDLGMN